MSIIYKRAASVAGNAGYTYTAPQNSRVKLLYGQVSLTTDATVANRRVEISIKDADGNTVIDFHAGAVVAASQTAQHHEFMQGIYRETSFVGGALQVPIGADLELQEGWSVNVAIDAGVAGDSYTATLVLKDV